MGSPKIYNFSLHRSGDGKIFDLGRGDLEHGRRLAAWLETEFVKWEAEGFPGDVREVVRSLEGSDIYANPADGWGPVFHLVDGWEEVSA